MFGKAYQFNLTFEVFMRYLSEGEQKISDVRKALYFIPKHVFLNDLQEAIQKGLLSINTDTKKIFLGKKVYLIIRFIEEYNIIEELENYYNGNNYKINEKLKTLLNDIKFFEEQKNEQFIDISFVINRCMKFLYKEDFNSEIWGFGFRIINKTE